MIEYKKGNIFNSQAGILVNPVNCVGVMGAGLALTFRLLWPEMFERYRELCTQKLLYPGKLWIWSSGPWKRVMCFPTKRHYKDWTEEYLIEAGLVKFTETYQAQGITHIAFPLLGAGRGRMNPEKSKSLIKKHLGNLPYVLIEVWEQTDPEEPAWIWEQFQAAYEGVDSTIARIILDCSSFEELAGRRGVSISSVQKEITKNLWG